MCHILLLMPVLALPLFWFVPLPIAAPVYGAILIVSGWVYFLAIRAMHRPVRTGMEALLLNTGEVIGKKNGVFQVRVRNEIWNAVSTDSLRPGDCIEVVTLEGMRLKVRRISETESVRLLER